MDMAVAFSDFDNEREYDLDPSFGSLVFMTTEWKTFPNGKTIDTETILPSHACSAQELGLDRDSENDFHVAPKNRFDVARYKKKFRCLRKEDLKIYGTYDTAKTRLINVYLAQCENEEYCRSPEEIKDFFANKFLLLLNN